MKETKNIIYNFVITFSLLLITLTCANLLISVFSLLQLEEILQLDNSVTLIVFSFFAIIGVIISIILNFIRNKILMLVSFVYDCIFTGIMAMFLFISLFIIKNNNMTSSYNMREAIAIIVFLNLIISSMSLEFFKILKAENLIIPKINKTVIEPSVTNVNEELQIQKDISEIAQ